MSSARSQDIESKHKNQLHFCLLAVNNEKIKLRQLHSQFYQKE